MFAETIGTGAPSRSSEDDRQRSVYGFLDYFHHWFFQWRSLISWKGTYWHANAPYNFLLTFLTKPISNASDTSGQFLRYFIFVTAPIQMCLQITEAIILREVSMGFHHD